MAVKGFDFAWTKPTPQQVKDAGGVFIAGYFSTDVSKNLNRNSIAAFLAAGVSVVTVWETTANRAGAGAAAGAWDCHAAEAERVAAGLPGDSVHYFATDFDAEWTQVEAYYGGGAGTIGIHRVGVYGGFKIVEAAYAAGYRYLWQTDAWSGGQISKHALIYQDGKTMWGGSADEDIAYSADYGQSPRPVIVPPKPPVPPVVKNKEPELILVEVDRTQVPKGVTWPGVFLLDNGELTHVHDMESLTAYQRAGVPGPTVISYEEYLERVPPVKAALEEPVTPETPAS